MSTDNPPAEPRGDQMRREERRDGTNSDKQYEKEQMRDKTR